MIAAAIVGLGKWVRAVRRAREGLGRRLAQAPETTMPDTLAAAPLLHAAALRYLREIGLAA